LDVAAALAWDYRLSAIHQHLAPGKCKPMSSPPTTPMSQASTRLGIDSSITLDDTKGFQRRAVEKVKQVSTSQDIFLFLVAFRILNALSVKTFFQPDEYFQSLEPAWQIAFGEDSGAWITWVYILPHTESTDTDRRRNG